MMNKLIIIIIFIILTFFLVFFLVLPKKEDLSFLVKKIIEKRAELQSKEDYLKNLNQLSQSLKNYQTQLLKIDSALPEDVELPTLFDFLQKTASQSGLVLKRITATPTKEGERVRQTQLNLVLSGRYSPFKDFLSILEKSARLIETESISFSREKEDLFNFNLRIKVYSY